MLTTQMALNQLAVNDFDGARADIKKTHEREALIARQREKEYERLEEEAKAQGVRVRYKDLQGYPVMTLDAPAVIALKKTAIRVRSVTTWPGLPMKRWASVILPPRDIARPSSCDPTCPSSSRHCANSTNLQPRQMKVMC